MVCGSTKLIDHVFGAAPDMLNSHYVSGHTAKAGGHRFRRRGRISEWIAAIGLDPSRYGTHSLRRTKATLIYRKTGNLRAVQLLLGHTKVESTVRYLGVEVDDALKLAEQVDV